MPMNLQTLDVAARRYKLRDPSTTNKDVGHCLGLANIDGDAVGTPSCCFFSEDGYLAAIRTKPDEVIVFHVFQSVQAMLAKIADRIND